MKVKSVRKIKLCKYLFVDKTEWRQENVTFVLPKLFLDEK